MQIEGSLWEGNYLRQLLYCSSMKITFCNGSACTWNQIVHEFHYLDTYIWFQGLFWLTMRVLFFTDLQKGTWLIQRWLIQLHGSNWTLLAHPTLQVTSQRCTSLSSWLWIMTAPAAIPTGTSDHIQSFVLANPARVLQHSETCNSTMVGHYLRHQSFLTCFMSFLESLLNHCIMLL